MVTIANVYMDPTIQEALKLAKKKLEISRSLHVNMDDTFAIIKQNSENNSHIQFLECLNSIHLSPRFTVKTEEDNKITFIDSLIKVYRKKSKTDLTNQNPIKSQTRGQRYRKKLFSELIKYAPMSSF